jgi:hypothetical protein
MQNMEKLVAYLSALPNCSGVKPVKVSLGRATYEGAQYVDSNFGTTPRLYLIGDLPKSYLRRRKTCYTFEGDSRDWYIAGYMTADRMTEKFAPYHPCGANVLLCAWDSPQGSIDSHEEKRYTRVAASLESVA